MKATPDEPRGHFLKLVSSKPATTSRDREDAPPSASAELAAVERPCGRNRRALSPQARRPARKAIVRVCVSPTTRVGPRDEATPFARTPGWLVPFAPFFVPNFRTLFRPGGSPARVLTPVKRKVAGAENILPRTGMRAVVTQLVLFLAGRGCGSAGSNRTRRCAQPSAVAPAASAAQVPPAQTAFAADRPLQNQANITTASDSEPTTLLT